MARFSLVFAAAGLLLLVAMAEATTKTIFTTTTTFEENPTDRTDMSCSQQLVEQAMLNHCVKYLETGSGMSMDLERTSEPTPAEKHLMLCCMQVRNIDEMCRCDAIKMMMNQQRWTQQQMGKVMGMAENLPKKCKVEPEMCKMRAVWF
ncbi:albumin-8 [Lactuca sativa]|uniref:albumin-8 n=1 Tax=Lactuca sativa TaxID=4236 RepID=UPI000CBB4D94|nr:albumin-8 [Lactuca sativa]